jgi:RNA polymerase primary sigma factor
MATTRIHKKRSKTNATELDPIQVYLKEISKIPLLTREEERELVCRARAGDKQAAQRLVESNLRFVIKIARKFQYSGVSLIDLINEGNIGLIEAVRRFDPEKNVRFLTYAVWWIRQAILHYVTHQGKMIPVGARIGSILYKVSKLSETPRAETGQLDRDVLAEKLGITVRELDEALQFTRNIVSVEEPLDETGEIVYGDTIAKEVVPPAEKLILADQMVRYLRSLMNNLTNTEKKILEMRFGLGDKDPMTLKEIGDEFGLSRERIRQIEVHSLEKLRRLITSSSLANYLN